MSEVAQEAFFLSHADGRRRFCVLHAPLGARGANVETCVRGVVVYLPPWADEMNKARRMARMQSRLLAAHGFAVLQVDPTGTGDSSADHGTATWAQWVEDGADALRWLIQRHPGAPGLLWGLRSGCMLACDLAAQTSGALGLLLWNPPPNGRMLWQQFVRLATAAALTGDAGKLRAEAIKQRLQQGLPVEIAGYEVSAALSRGLEDSTLQAPGRLAAAAILETSSQPGAELSPALAAAAKKWRAQGHTVHTARVQGPAFWQTTEIEDAPDLLPATLKAAQQLLAKPPAHT